MNQKDRRRHELAKPGYAALMKVYPFTLDDLDGEVWKTIPDYEDYQVSNFGRVKSFHKGKVKILKPCCRVGYLNISLCKNGKHEHFRVNRLVAKLFLSNPDNLPQVNHKDGHPMNNYVGNLEWCTQSENQQHAYNTGLQAGIQGEEHYKAKLTNEQVLYIRENPDSLTGKQLAEKFGVCDATIINIQCGKTYKNAGGSVRKARPTKYTPPLPEEIRKQIRAAYVKGSKEFNCRALAKKYGVHHKTILNIVRA